MSGQDTWIHCINCKGSGFELGLFSSESPCFSCMGLGFLDSDQDFIPYSVAALALRSETNKLQRKVKALREELAKRPKPKEQVDPYKGVRRRINNGLYTMD